MRKLAIITSHPIQYYAPWFRYLTNNANLAIKVFYLWDFGITQQVDAGFHKALQWDIPLLTGYEYEFVANVSSNPGTHHFWGLQNPALSSQVSAYHPDAVLLMVYNYASIYRFLGQWDTRQIPLIFRGDSHRLIPSHGIKAVIRRQIISQIYRRFAVCLYVGKANYDYFQYHNVPSNKLLFSPHAVDSDRFLSQAETAKQQAIAWKQEIGIPQDHAVILFAGKFEAKKRPVDLLQAFLQAKLDRVSLLFVGDGNLEKELKSQALGQENIYFVPFQNQSLMPRTYAIADLVVLPSYGNYETWGLAINEAMCLSRPVIVSTHVGCAQDLVHPGKNGLIFPAGDVSALAQSLQEAFSDRQRLHSWGEEGRRIVSDYSYMQATQGLNQALNYIIKSKINIPAVA
ncbi:MULTISPECIES: glycosyltransferase family 4 protein [unclassified Tolypothrix]|uniref:glycosyltransferase family 4 protein n=1 Tax=unclassified Tolypothrix TaxID=2649714 RepID=UPI0005EAC602|nr:MULTISPECIES: glycosyltransferase family 4 protein [unclassified Tolypothrix]BAY92042.1 group 1 glycosyl transferase [Microchaete diplosiphon NIES-3275]EKF04762.1 glycosyltransferase, group 1 family [Tolypothrix sp. PCC 7601]MBE9081753.1 glycosyltransferase family 4 protein [Tolypothrix sp. LEGE 11397]UYD26030.1 glycosyltransferase family 4 protein [Tolypothrix sp. PCC 7712]UYD31731.1 glycosyltransferase family 4 protein [Tolypothrix sp. PCC 7601]